MQQLARDEAGNVWETDASGNALRLHQAAASASPSRGRIFSVPLDPRTVHKDDLADAREGRAVDAAARSARNEERRINLDQRKQDEEQETALDGNSVTYIAQQVLSGAPMPPMGMGRQGAANRAKVSNEVARLAGAAGLTGSDAARQIAHYKAGTKAIGTLETMAGTIGVNEQTALANGQQFLDRSAELPGQARFAPVNAVSDWIQRRFGGTTIAASDAAYNTFVNEYAKVVSGSPSGAGTLSDSARHEAMETIRGNASLEQKQAAFQQMKTDMANRMTAIHGGIDNAYKALTNQPGYHVPDATQGLATGAMGGPGGGGNGGGGGGPKPFDPTSLPSGGEHYDATAATGATRREPVPQADAIVNAALRAGWPVSQTNAELARQGFATIQPDSYANYQGAVDHFRRFPKDARSASSATREVPTTLANRAAASPLGTFLGSTADAAMAGLSDELAGTVNAAFNGKGVAQNIADLNTAKQAAFAASPKSAFAGQALGTGLSMFGAGRALQGSRLAIGLGKAAPYVGNAAAGALAGAGQDNDNRLGGAILGATLAAGGQAVGSKVIAPAFGAAARTAPGLAVVNAGRAAVSRIPGGPTLMPIGAVTAPSDATRMLSNALEKADPAMVTAQLGEASRLGLPMTLADTHPELRELTGAAVRRSPSASQIAETTLVPRARGQIDRLGAAVTRDLGPVANIPQVSADLTAQARKAAGPLYDAAYARPGASSVNLDDLMQRPSMRAGLKQAHLNAAEEGRDPTTLGFGLNDQGEVVLTRVPSYETLDYVKQGLDDTLEPHRNVITNKLNLNPDTRAINRTRAQLLSRVDATNPEYAAARQAYAGPSQARDAPARGQDAFPLDPDELGMQVATQSPEHLAQMQTGYRSALMGRANAVRDVTNPYEATLGTPAAQQRLNTLYSNSPGVPNLLRTRTLERQMSEAGNAILGNSKTAQRQIADEAFATSPLIEGALHAGAAVATHGASVPGTAARFVGAGLRNTIKLGIGERAVRRADELAPLLLNLDPVANAATVQDVANQLAQYQAYRVATTPRGMFGRLGAASGAATGLDR